MHPYIDTSSRWVFSLRRLMGYPTFSPVANTIAFTATAASAPGQRRQLATIAADMGCDIVHIAFDGVGATVPCTVSLALRQAASVEWIPDCKLYAAGPTARIEILGPDRRWSIGPRHIMTGAKLPPIAKRACGEEIAWRRWQQLVAIMPAPELAGSAFVRPGDRIADAIPMDDLAIAA